MNHLHHRTWIILGAISLFVALLLVAGPVFAGRQAAPEIQATTIHPIFTLLDAEGKNVLERGTPVSTLQTCGQCHDTAYITSHSFHVDLGLSEQVSPGQVVGGQPWDTSPGLYGKWNPLLYRRLSPASDGRPDLDTSAWVAFNASRIVGGGPADASRVEMNCFLCHLEQPNNQERITAIQAGNGAWASTATLVGTGLVEVTASGYSWNPEAFVPNTGASGALQSGSLSSGLEQQIQDPSNANCAQCHGLVHTDSQDPLLLVGCELEKWQTATTGQVISGQRIALSGMNLEGKDELARSWDIHSERGLECTDCHFSLNNPVYAQVDSQTSPSHLEFDPRRLEIGEYLLRPDHNFARGQSAQTQVASELRGTMRRCESCHDTQQHSDWLPYLERHLEEVACETCHIPQLYAPAVESVDWTVLQASDDQPMGGPVTSCRGVEGESGTLSDLVTGFQPVLLQRRNVDGDVMLAPYNLVTSWYWVYDDPNGPRPVRLEDLQAAWFADQSGAAAAYAPEILQAFDANQDRQLDSSELKIDTPEKQALIANRLQALGLQNPRIEGQVQPYSINHNVTRGEWAVSDCQICHNDDSRLSTALILADELPGGVLPSFVADTNTLPSSNLELQDGKLVYQPALEENGLYVFGHNRVPWVDWLGALFFVGALTAVAGHGSLRLVNLLRQPHHKPALKRVYMYAVYERFWHWLQTFTIVLLLFTGLIIHRPDLFGWLSFRHMVTLHNMLAAILVINAGLSLFYHLVSGQIQQYLPRPYGFFDQAILQAKFYLRGIFHGENHPFEKTPQKKLNPLQQATYFGILNVLLPLQIITGALMWGVQQWPQVAGMLGGLPFLAPFHSLVAWAFGSFIVGHVYLTTTGHEPLAGIKAMMNGWEDVELHPGEEAEVSEQEFQEGVPVTGEMNKPGQAGAWEPSPVQFQATNSEQNTGAATTPEPV
jgi:thiosulfate reductase cytochrome b subunit